MHLLRRIIAGINGEVLEPMKEEEPESDDRVLDSQGTPGDGDGGKNKRKFNKDQTVEGEWEDPEKFAREQGEEEDVGEAGERSNFVAEVSDEPEVHPDAEDGGAKVVSKEDRKAAKKAKRQAEKREKNEKVKKMKMNHGSDEEYI